MFGLKKKLMAAVAMLTVSAMMLTTASFAWFTISTNPEISGMSATVVTNENLEIALAKGSTTPGAAATGDTTKAYTYGNLIDFSSSGYTTDVTSVFAALDTTLRPVTVDTTAGNAFQYPTYGVDGRVNTLSTALGATAQTAGVGNLIDDDGLVYGYYIDFYVRSNVAGDLALTTATERSSEGADGSGSIFTVASTVSESVATVLADNITIAFDVGPTVTAIATTAGVAADVLAITGNGTTVYDATFTCDKITTLVANTDTLVRMYVYLDGTNVTNASASIETALATGTLNVQFTVSGVDVSMDDDDITTVVTAGGDS